MKNLRVKFGQSMIRALRKTRQAVEVDTQKIRAKLLQNLKKQFETANAFAMDKNLTLRERQFWMKICGYIGQVINSLAKSFDESKVSRQLDELERMIREGTGEAN